MEKALLALWLLWHANSYTVATPISTSKPKRSLAPHVPIAARDRDDPVAVQNLGKRADSAAMPLATGHQLNSREFAASQGYSQCRLAAPPARVLDYFDYRSNINYKRSANQRNTSLEELSGQPISNWMSMKWPLRIGKYSIPTMHFRHSGTLYHTLLKAKVFDNF